jgi:FkbM family methyltransferase
MFNIKSYYSTNFINKTLSYLLNVHPLTLQGYHHLMKTFVSYALDRLRGFQKAFDCYVERGMIVKTWDGFLIYVRPRTSDFYSTCFAEVYELENWFKPLAKGVIVDVGAYIGTYTVRAMYTADLVIAIEPLPLNFKALQLNVKLNNHRQKAEVILVNKAVAGERMKETKILLPIESGCIEASTASLKAPLRKKYLSYIVSTDTLDNILSELGIEKVNLLKIDIEGYVLESLPGMLNTLKNTRWLLIELLEDDISIIRTLKNQVFV